MEPAYRPAQIHQPAQICRIISICPPVWILYPGQISRRQQTRSPEGLCPTGIIQGIREADSLEWVCVQTHLSRHSRPRSRLIRPSGLSSRSRPIRPGSLTRPVRLYRLSQLIRPGSLPRPVRLRRLSQLIRPGSLPRLSHLPRPRRT